MGTKRRDDLAGRTRVLVDGSNQRGPGSALQDEPYARSLRAMFPASPSTARFTQKCASRPEKIADSLADRVILRRRTLAESVRTRPTLG
jgi:hypothetical protein